MQTGEPREMVAYSSQPGRSKEGVIKDTTNAVHAQCCTTPLDALKPITLDQITEPKVYRGHYLICRTLTDAALALATTVVVEDLNEDEQEVTLIHVTTSYGTAFPCGTIMVIKEPNAVSPTLDSSDDPRCSAQEAAHTKLGICVMSPTDIVLLDETDEILAKLGAHNWCKPETLNADELRLAGNKCFAAKDFGGSLKLYERALRLQPDAAVLLLNKSAALLKLERFSEAYSVAEKALHAGADKEKALFRMGQSMVGFAYEASHWQKAASAFETLVQEFPANKEGRALLKRAEDRLREWRTGKYDMNRLYTEAIEQGKRNIEIAQFVGSIDTVEIPGKGKGLVASKDVPKGTLLMVSKAIACSSLDDFKDYDLSCYRCVNAESKCVLLNEIRIAQTMLRNRESAASVYSLWAGEEYSREDAPSTQCIDTARIHKICQLNSFNIDAPLPVTDGNTQVEAEKRSTIHVLPAFVNHSCVGNAYRAFYGDVLVGHAIRDIKKGEEITWSYVEGEQPLEAREESLRHYGFRCECELCQLDRSDTRHEEREKIAKKCEKMVPLMEKEPERYVAEFASLVRQMRETYSARMAFRLRLKDPLNALFVAYSEVGRLEDALQAGKESLECLDEYHLFTIGPEICLKLATLLNDLIWNAHDEGNERLVGVYEKQRDKYLHGARERVRVRSGMDLDIQQYRLAKGYLPELP
ncbi:TPR domain protein [Aphelenchoides avenae]|nr:TPR domain protein [Aphelenchus avenae]